MCDNFKTIIYNIPSHCGHLGTVKNVIDKMKAIHNDVIVHEGILINIESVFSPIHEEDRCLLVHFN